MTRARAERQKGGRRGAPGWLRLGSWLLLGLASLATVTWRQTHGLEMERALRTVETERAVAEGQRVDLVRQAEALRSRSRVVRVARDRLGMQLPADSQIVFLPVAPSSAALGPVRR